MQFDQVDSHPESGGTQKHQVQRRTFTGQAPEIIHDFIAEEVPVAFVYNGISHAVMMATPDNLGDFALGFSLSEAIIHDINEIYDIECNINPDVCGVEVQMQISSERFAGLKERRRNLTGNTGCGLCGKENLKALQLQVPAIDAALTPTRKLPCSSLSKVLAALDSHQAINLKTGAVHAASWVDMAGEIQILREDVGRHNALDKLIGALAQQHKKLPEGFILMSSRLSYELVQKAARANVAILAALSAPTTLAINLAGQAGICLIGFVREHGFVVYSHPERLLAE